MKKLTERLLGAGLAGLICVGTAAAETRELRYANGFPPGSLPITVAEAYAQAVNENSGGELAVRVYALSLLSMAETSPGLRDGIADIGFVLTPYYPAEYPHNNLVAEASMLLRLMDEGVRGHEGAAFVPAISEFIFQNCPECHEEFRAQNQVYTGHLASSSYGLICNTPVVTTADLVGKRLRVGSANWSRWTTEMGATPVTMSANEMLEALSQGVVDCTILSAPEIDNFSLREAVTDITMAVPGGIFAVAGQNVNRGVWTSLTDEQRTAMLRGSALSAAMLAWRYQERERDVLGELEEAGITVHEADPALVEATQDFVENDLDTIAAYFANNHGVTRGAEMIAEFRPILEKWSQRVVDVETIEELTELYWTEVFSKVDVASYGQ